MFTCPKSCSMLLQHIIRLSRYTSTLYFFTLGFFLYNAGELMKLPTLDNNTCIDAELIQEKAEDTILKAAKFVLGLSSYIGM